MLLFILTLGAMPAGRLPATQFPVVFHCLVPPLVVTEADIGEALAMMRRAATDLANAPKAAAQ
jgi:hypothetical protein